MAYLDQKQIDRAVRRAIKHGYFDAGIGVIVRVDAAIEGIWANAVHNCLLANRRRRELLYSAADQTNFATRFGAQMMKQRWKIN